MPSSLGKCRVLPTDFSHMPGPSACSSQSEILKMQIRLCNCPAWGIQRFPLVLRLKIKVLRKPARSAESGRLHSLQVHLSVLSHFLHGRHQTHRLLSVCWKWYATSTWAGAYLYWSFPDSLPSLPLPVISDCSAFSTNIVSLSGISSSCFSPSWNPISFFKKQNKTKTKYSWSQRFSKNLFPKFYWDIIYTHHCVHFSFIFLLVLSRYIWCVAVLFIF